MASIRKRKGKWQVQIRRKGFQLISRTFSSKADALEWSRLKERQVDKRDILYDVKALDHTSWKELLERYRDTIVTAKKSKLSETNHINAYLKREKIIVSLPLSAIKSHHFITYRDKRLENVKPATICRELGIFRHVFEIAKTEWGYPIAINPLERVRKPKINNRRERRLNWKEYRAILKATDGCKNEYIKPIIQIAVHTGMRRGEILSIKLSHIDNDKRTLHIPDTKTGYSRTIPLSLKTYSLLQGIEVDKGQRLFPITSNAFRMAWDRILNKAQIQDLKFHDLRHEAISRFFEKGLSIPEVALISGHKDFRMLSIYTHLKPEDLAKRL